VPQLKAQLHKTESQLQEARSELEQTRSDLESTQLELSQLRQKNKQRLDKFRSWREQQRKLAQGFDYLTEQLAVFKQRYAEEEVRRQPAHRA